jgi:hypothetical protein
MGMFTLRMNGGADGRRSVVLALTDKALDDFPGDKKRFAKQESD